MGVHATTHVDAPWHFGEICEGKRAKYIDEIPLEWCFAPGKLLNVSQKEESSPIEIKDLEKALEESQIQIKPMDIVQTGDGLAFQIMRTVCAWTPTMTVSHTP